MWPGMSAWGDQPWDWEFPLEQHQDRFPSLHPRARSIPGAVTAKSLGQPVSEHLVPADASETKGCRGDDDNGRMTALLGFVDIQALFDGRVKKLFEEKLECPGEVEIIKKDYM